MLVHVLFQFLFLTNINHHCLLDRHFSFFHFFFFLQGARKSLHSLGIIFDHVLFGDISLCLLHEEMKWVDLQILLSRIKEDLLLKCPSS